MSGDLRAVIAESVVRVRNHGVPGSWHVGPSMRSEGLGERLVASGFTSGGSEAGMAVRLDELRTPEVVPGLEIAQMLGELDELATWEATLGLGFGEDVKEARWVAEVYRKLVKTIRGVTTWAGSTVSRWPRPRSSSAPAWPGCTS